MKISEQIQNARFKAKMTRRALSKATGINYQCLTRYENGTTSPSWEKVEKISAALGVTFTADSHSERHLDETRVINMTPHDIHIIEPEGQGQVTLPPSGLVRLKSETKPAGTIGQIPISRTVFGEPEGLPEPKEGIFYVVSQLVKSALRERKDLLVPAEVVRNEKGNIIGCRSLGL